MIKHTIKILIQIIIFASLSCGIYLTQNYLDAVKAKDTKYYVEKNILITLPTNIIKNITLGFDNMIADIAWLQFVQYYGENSRLKNTGKTIYDFSYTYKYIEVVTTLDPNFSYAYWFGSFAIADEMERPDLAIKILKLGIKNNPDNWWLPYTAGIMELMYNNSFVNATKYIDLAARLQPKTVIGNYNIGHISKVLHSKAKKQEKLIAIWLGIYNDAAKKGDKLTMERARKNLKKRGYDVTNM